MGLFEKAQQVVDATPASANWTVMLGSLILSVFQPIAVVVTVVWGCLQIHGWVEKKWGRDFLWLNRVFGKKGK